MKRYLVLSSLLLAGALTGAQTVVTTSETTRHAGVGTGMALSAHADAAGCTAAVAASGAFGQSTCKFSVFKAAPAWTRIAAEGGTFTVAAGSTVRYGAGTSFRQRVVSGAGQCTTVYFGGDDPAWGVGKACDVLSGDAVPAPPVVVPPVVVPPVVVPPPPAGAVTYYFSDCQIGATAGCLLGRNASAGTQADPKQNLAGINVNALPTGSRLLFARGGSWNWTQTTLENLNARAATPLVFDAYGTGPLPWFRQGSGNMFNLGGGWNNTSNDGGYTFRNIKFDGNDTAEWGFWFVHTVRDVVIENSEITGFRIGVNSNDTDAHTVRGITLRNNHIHRNRAMGMLGHYSDLVMEGNLIEANNFSGSGLDHGSYIGGGQNITIRNNRYIRNSVVNGVCQGGNMTFHGQIDGMLIEGNTIEQDSAAAGCWLMSVTRGYTTPEWFRNTVIRNNRLINGGNTAMAVQSAPGVLVEGNVAINTRATFQTGFSIGVGPTSPTSGGDAGDVGDTGAIVRNNTACQSGGATGSVVSVNSPGGAVSNNAVLASTTGACAR